MLDIERILKRNAEAILANSRGEFGIVVRNSLRDVKELVAEIARLTKKKEEKKNV